MISSLNQETWDKKTIELGGSILQSWDWGQFQEALGQKVHRFSDDDFICSVIETPLSMGKKYLYSPRGPIGKVESALVDLKKLEEDPQFVFCRIEPHHAVDLPKAIKDIQPRHNWMLSVDKSEEELLIGMKPKTRYNLNLAQRKGVVVKEGTKADLVQFYQLMLEVAARNKIRLHSQDYYLQMWEHLAPQKLKLFLAYYQDQLLAGALVSFFADTATYLHGGSSQKMKEAMAPYLLHWEAIKQAKALGSKTYDFGGVAPDSEPNHSWSGITRFKKGFGGFEVSYPGAFDLVYSPIWYNVYRNARQLRNLLR
jgi:peptidoglycan pentaglycine glycine transferase (the first glycine)